MWYHWSVFLWIFRTWGLWFFSDFFLLRLFIQTWAIIWITQTIYRICSRQNTCVCHTLLWGDFHTLCQQQFHTVCYELFIRRRHSLIAVFLPFCTLLEYGPIQSVCYPAKRFARKPQVHIFTVFCLTRPRFRTPDLPIPDQTIKLIGEMLLHVFEYVRFREKYPQHTRFFGMQLCQIYSLAFTKDIFKHREPSQCMISF